MTSPSSPTSIGQPAHLVVRGLEVAAASLVIALVLAFMHDGSLIDHLVHSEAIGLCSWASIEGGRHLLRSRLGVDWFRGGTFAVLVICGCAFGFAAGTAIGDLVMGGTTWQTMTDQPRALASALAGSLLVGTVISMYFYLRGRTAHHQAQMAQAERDTTLARLTMLQSQLEPHMLFNTLANLRVLITLDPPRAQAMLDQLIAFLRATLSASRVGSHALSAEFERLDDYLALMSVRMGSRLRTRLALPDDLRSISVPPLLLQPLVENAIKHGLEPKAEGGRIEVTARRDGDTLVLDVRDTSIGLSQALASEEGTRFGLQQIRERLHALYDDRASFAITAVGNDEGEGGTLARIILPLTTPPPTAP